MFKHRLLPKSMIKRGGRFYALILQLFEHELLGAADLCRLNFVQHNAFLARQMGCGLVISTFNTLRLL
ncbi:hypothetical protein CW745_12035 [Psychromonas sp. psych-6C06]|nr:hypothetical protein CW745_12035 [Psychromonas sp. psych-6C06]